MRAWWLVFCLLGSAWAQVPIPDVVGLDPLTARTRLSRAGIDFRVIQMAAQPAGTVLFQEPVAGGVWEGETPILLTVGVEPQPEQALPAPDPPSNSSQGWLRKAFGFLFLQAFLVAGLGAAWNGLRPKAAETSRGLYFEYVEVMDP